MTLRHCLIALLLAATALASGCATTRRQPAEEAPQASSVEQIRELDIRGRVAIREGRSGENGGILWHHKAPYHHIKILAPLGQVVAQIIEDDEGVTLTTANKETVRAQDPEALMEKMLGWRLPLKGMQHWVLGVPSPASDAKTERDASHRIAKITQDNWEIAYSNYRPVAATELPGRIVMRRDDIEVRFVVDDWKVIATSP